MALFWFWASERGWPTAAHKTFIEGWMPEKLQAGWLWGEAAVPQILMYLWYRRDRDATPRPDLELAAVLQAICERNHKKMTVSFPGPYYLVEDVVRHQLRGLLGVDDDRLGRETRVGSSFAAEGLMHLLARTGLKQTCKRLWPEYSKLDLYWFEPSHRWKYCLWRCKDGIERSRQLPLRETWNNLVEEARDCRGHHIPGPLPGIGVYLCFGR